jgi:hypothetical protein
MVVKTLIYARDVEAGRGRCRKAGGVDADDEVTELNRGVQARRTQRADWVGERVPHCVSL